MTEGHLASIDGTLHLDDHYTFTSLDAGDLRGLDSLEGISMRLDLRSVPAGLFDDLTNLRVLRLYREGQTPSLPAGLLDRLTNLEELVLQSDPQHPDMFRALGRLQVLWVYGGGIAEGSINHLSELQELRVFGEMPRLGAGALVGLTELRLLDLSGIGLSEVDANAFVDLGALTHLFLHQNQIESLPEGVFDGLIALEELWLLDNPLTELPRAPFRDLTSLDRLDLGTGVMESLDSDLFVGLANLRELYLFGPNLNELPAGLLQPLADLNWLGLRSPSLSVIPPDLFLGLTQLTTVHVDAGPNERPLLMVTLRKITASSFAADVVQATPFPLTLYLRAEGGTLSNDTVVVPAGQTSSEIVHVAPGESSHVEVLVSNWSFPNGYTHDGFSVTVARGWRPVLFSFD